MSPSKEQIQAFALLDANLHPGKIGALAATGTRDNWRDLNYLIETLRPLFVEQKSEPEPEPKNE